MHWPILSPYCVQALCQVLWESEVTYSPCTGGHTQVVNNMFEITNISPRCIYPSFLSQPSALRGGLGQQKMQKKSLSYWLMNFGGLDTLGSGLKI